MKVYSLHQNVIYCNFIIQQRLHHYNQQRLHHKITGQGLIPTMSLRAGELGVMPTPVEPTDEVRTVRDGISLSTSSSNEVTVAATFF